MSIRIYTYSDPYKLNQEEYWEQIIECPYFCASQTLVNGLRSLYKNDYQAGRVTTVLNLVEMFFEQWMGTAGVVKQHADIDNIMAAQLWSTDEKMDHNIRQAFQFNREDVLESIRVMAALDIQPCDIDKNYLYQEQKILVGVYEKILSSDYLKDFLVNTNIEEESVDLLLRSTLNKAYPNNPDLKLDYSRVVFHGIHQFTPIMLRAIELIGRYKDVILLFNYQEQYSNLYQTWIDIYRAIDDNITLSTVENARPNIINKNSYPCNVLADNLGKLMEGKTESIDLSNDIEILEFNNKTEFANYVADRFESAKHHNSESPLNAMKEQFYAADTSVNDILKIYYPDQFGERQFLNYPLGHFFVAIANMWDDSTNEMVVTDGNNIKECLNAGIIEEKAPGSLSSLFNQVEALFSGIRTIDEMISRLKRVKKNKKTLFEESLKEELEHISYYSISNEEIEALIKALETLKRIAHYFFEDFGKESNNFKAFYKKIKQYLKDELEEVGTLDEEFSDIIRRVLLRLEEVEEINATASFECLKSTMSIYLLQETKPGKSANWIVRGFEQIDGDILLIGKWNGEINDTIYHFACLSDEDILSSKVLEFPWPLTSDFFDVAQSPIDWKTQVYVKARKEYKNFKKYALLYGLEFNRANYKLSYIKQTGEKEKEPYYLLNILGLNTTPYFETINNKYLEPLDAIEFQPNQNNANYTVFDYYRFKMCPYRFLLETHVEGNTVYKDEFILARYMEVVLENHLKRTLEGFLVSETIVDAKLSEIYDSLKRYFPFATESIRMDAINKIRQRFLGAYKGKTFVINDNEKEYMAIRELFIQKQLQDRMGRDIQKSIFETVSEETIIKKLSPESLTSLKYKKAIDLWCKYCANSEVCLGIASR